MFFPFDVPAELLGPYILREIPSHKLKIILKNNDIFKHVQTLCPSIIKDCFTPVEPILHDAEFKNVHDMRQYIASKDATLINKIIIILNYEWYFVNPLRLILKMIKEYDHIDLPLLVEKLLIHTYPYSRRRSPKNLAPLIKFFIDEMEYDPSIFSNEAIRYACENGHSSLVELLLNDIRVNPSAVNNYAIRYASKKGHTQVVKLLLNDTRVDASDFGNYAIRMASKRGYFRIVEMLLKVPRVDPSAVDDNAIISASSRGYFQVVKMLLDDPRVDPLDKDNYNILWLSLSRTSSDR